MQHAIPAFILALTMVGGSAASAQQLPEADPGVRPTRLIDRAEVRVSRLDIQPGSVRRVHAHDDVVYHLWIPIEGTLELTVRNEPPVAGKPGQAFFMTRGTPHGFKNVGSTPAAVFEIFIKQTTTAASQDFLGALLQGLMADADQRVTRSVAR
jgi:quercetin dioxygenase-like cupin family protein